LDNYNPVGHEPGHSTKKQIIESKQLLAIMQKRRTVRSFSNEPVRKEIVEDCIKIAASAPSGANSQQWSFVLVENLEMKQKIRARAEEVESKFYADKITKEWKAQLKPLSTSAFKPFLEEAPFLICIFQQKYGYDEKGRRKTHYYSSMSLGIAAGFLITALHLSGLSCLTYTPAPMNFLSALLERPENEKPYMIIVVGYPDENYIPPDIPKKTSSEYLTII